MKLGEADRAVQGLPPEAKAGVAVLLKLLTLPAAVVGVKHEATLVIAFHQYLHDLSVMQTIHVMRIRSVCIMCARC